MHLIDKYVPKRPLDGWLPSPEELQSSDIERLALLKQAGLWDSLVKELERLVYLNPTSAVLRNNLSWAYIKINDYSGSIEQAETLLHRKDAFEDIGRAHLFDKLFPEPKSLPFAEYSKEYNVTQRLALSIAREESHFDPDLVSWAGAKGLMQVMNSTGRWIAGKLGVKKFKPSKLYYPRLNIRMGCWYLDHLCRRFKGIRDSNLLAMASYNAGPGNVSRWLKSFDGQGGFEEMIESWHLSETRFYIKKVGRSLLCYELLGR